MSKKVAIVLADGFEPIEAVAPVDILRRAGVEVMMVAAKSNLEVDAAHGVKFVADTSIGDVDMLNFDMLVIPGGAIGVQNLAVNSAFMDAAKRFMVDERLVGAICAGPTLLADLGVLNGYTATCYPGLETNFPEGSYPEKPGVYHDRNLITASGPGYALEFGRELARALVGDKKADAVASDMLF